MSAKKYRARTTGLTLVFPPMVLQCGLALMSIAKNSSGVWELTYPIPGAAVSLASAVPGDEGQQLIADVGYVPIRWVAASE